MLSKYKLVLVNSFFFLDYLCWGPLSLEIRHHKAALVQILTVKSQTCCKLCFIYSDCLALPRAGAKSFSERPGLNHEYIYIFLSYVVWINSMEKNPTPFSHKKKNLYALTERAVQQNPWRKHRVVSLQLTCVRKL